MTTTLALAWIQTVCSFGGFSRALLYQDRTIPQACCQAQRCHRSESLVEISCSGIWSYLSGWRISCEFIQSTYSCSIRWYSAASSSNFCNLAGLAWSSLRWVIAFFTIFQPRDDPFFYYHPSLNPVPGSTICDANFYL